MKRTLCDQHFSRSICALAEVVINTGEDNYITTADADEAAHTVIASQFVTRASPTAPVSRPAHRPRPLVRDRSGTRGHDRARAQREALLVRTLFPEAPIKYMPRPSTSRATSSSAVRRHGGRRRLGDGAGDPAPRHDDRGDAQPLPHGPLRRAEERRLRVPGLAVDGRRDHAPARRPGGAAGAGDAPRGAGAPRGGRPRRPHEGDRQGALRRSRARRTAARGSPACSPAGRITSTRSSRSWRRDEPLRVLAACRRRPAAPYALRVRRPQAGALPRAEGDREQPRDSWLVYSVRALRFEAPAVAPVGRRPAREARGSGRHGVVRGVDAGHERHARRTRKASSPAPRSP